MTVEQKPKKLTSQQELATNATMFVHAKTESDKDGQVKAVTAITDILSQNPSLIGEFAESQKAEPGVVKSN